MEVNLAYRCFLDLALDDKVPHFTTYGKNDSRFFRDKKLISEVFSRVLNRALSAGLIESSELFVDEALSKRQRIVTSIVKKRKFQRQTLIVVGSTKANIRKPLSVLPKWLMIGMVGPWLIRLKQEMFMIARFSLLFFQSWSLSPYTI